MSHAAHVFQEGPNKFLMYVSSLSYILKLNDIHQKVPVFLGSPGDVNELVDHISTHYSQIQ